MSDVELVSDGPYKYCRVVRREGDKVFLESPYGEEGLEELAADIPTRMFPPCCYAETNATLAEAYYAAYNRGGPVERAGLTWDNRPVPAWADLAARAAHGDASASGVIEKWKAVATFSNRL